MQKTYTRMARSCRLTAGAQRDTPAAAMRLGLASVGDLAKIKDKEKGKAERHRGAFSAF